MPIDPFAVKQHPKWHPVRAFYTLWARAQEWRSKRAYEAHALPTILPESTREVPHPDTDTAVTTEQYQVLLEAIRHTEPLSDTSVVEVGAYRGKTTRFLATNTARKVFAVDPYVGYGGSEADYTQFLASTTGLENIVHLKQTSGDAARKWSHGRSIGLVFIDAVHDFVNTHYDVTVWSHLVVPGGLIALHDVDNPSYSGTRAVAYGLRAKYTLWRHVDNLAVFEVPARLAS